MPDESASDPRTNGVLAGLKVVEFAQNAAVPQCGRLLAGMGAEVVKVEPNEGDAMRQSARLTKNEARAYATINPGKRAMCLDLASPDAVAVVDALIDWADVCLVGLKAGDVERFGLSWARVHERNPRLVQMSLTAFGPEGPDADQGGYDVLVQAMSGLGFSMNRSETGVPMPTRPALFDFSSGAIAALGVVAALRHRDTTGVGQRVDASLLGGALSLGTPVIAAFDQDKKAMAAVREGIDLLQQSGADFDTQRSTYESQVVAGAGVFRIYFRHYLTSDGIVSVAGMSPGLVAKFHEITGLDAPPNLDPSTPEFQAVVTAAEELFTSRTTADWIRDLRSAGYPCTRFNYPYEAVDDPQAVANDYVVDLEHPDFGGYRTVGMPFSFDATPTAITGPSPRLGEHTADVLAEIGLDADLIASLHHAGVVTSRDEADE